MSAPASPGQPRPGGGSGPRPGGGSGTGPKSSFAAVAVQALTSVAVGLVLIVAALTAPAPAAEPLHLQWRTATEQERRDYDARRLAEALDEQRRQHTQTPAITPEPAPVFPTSAGAGNDHPQSRAGAAHAGPAAHTTTPGVRREAEAVFRGAVAAGVPVGPAEVLPAVGLAGP